MVSILLATYNGEPYISEQLDSLIGQTFKDFVIYICDDQSTDSTLSIIQEYAAQYHKKIFVTQNGRNTGSPKHNFIKMMIEHKDDYIMLCDQDDVWLPDKIEKTLNKTRELETTYGKTTPILVHTDLRVVDERLGHISGSVLKEVLSDCSKTSLNKKIVQNTVTGCTIMYNRALADMIQTEPEYMIMHDWWVLLIASAFGKIGTIYEPTVLYRQHENNEIGAKKKQSLGEYFFYKFSHCTEIAGAIHQTYLQAGSFIIEFDEKLSCEQKELLAIYSSMPTLSRIRRFRTVLKYKIFRHGFVRKFTQFVILLIERRSKSIKCLVNSLEK